jgi:hypothetical protein
VIEFVIVEFLLLFFFVFFSAVGCRGTAIIFIHPTPPVTGQCHRRP